LSILSANKFAKSYQSRRVVDDVSLTVHSGQVVGLLDEPFAGVAPISTVDIQQIIRQLCARDIGIRITDHNVREALGICDHACIMNEGGVIAVG